MIWRCIAVVVAVLPLLAAGIAAAQNQGPAITPEQTEFVNLSLERILEAQAQEEGILAASLRSVKDSVAALEAKNTDLSRRLQRTNQQVADRREAAKRTGRRLSGLRNAGMVGIDLDQEDARRHRERLTALAQAEATASSLTEQLTGTQAALASVRQLEAAAAAALSAAQQENQAERNTLEAARSAWVGSETPQGEYWSALTATVSEVAARSRATCKVKFQSRPQSGVTLRYQLFDDRLKGNAPKVVNNPTETTEDLNIGLYYVWYESNGVPRSDPDRQYPLVQKECPITVDIWP
jgi:hypothetical protein